MAARYEYVDEPAQGRYEFVDEKAPAPSFKEQMLKRETNDLSSGIRRGLRDIVDTGAELAAKGYDKLTGADGHTLSSLITGEKPQGEYARVKAMNDAGKAEWEQGTGGELLPHVQRFGGNMLGTGPVLGGVGRVVGGMGLPGLGNAIGTAGMTTGRALPPALDMGTRVAGGAINGYASAGLVDPASATTGGVIGALTPPVVTGVGKLANSAAAAVRGPGVPATITRAVEQAREAGFVIPPTQGNPTLKNRALEGFAGKLTTAQQASAKNQPVTNQFAMKAIGADDLTPESLQIVRDKANSAYDALAQVGTFQADDAFRQALGKAGSRQSQLKADFPELVNKEIETLLESMGSRPEFGAQSSIEAIKRLRFDGSANKVAQDPGKKALGQAQMKIAGALEDLIDRNLQKTGAQDLLAGYRDARKTLAMVYDVEKALNPTTGNIDAAKLAARVKQGKSMSGELRTIADFAGAFPTAAKTPERMGSLPGVSPLDFGAMTALSGMAGDPRYLAGIVARPMARSMALSPKVQDGLLSRGALPSAPGGLLGDVDLSGLLYRAAPLLGSAP
jgi:hypothetical protein